MDNKSMIDVKKRSFRIKITSSVCILLLLILGLIFSLVGAKYSNKAELTQLTNNSNSQMMGYFINAQDKNIVIDGGTKEDSQNLQKYIKDSGGTVNAWFITHPHKDHAGAIIDIIENTDIKIEHIYVTLNDIEWYQKNEPQRAEEAIQLKDALENDRVKDVVTEVSLNQKIKIGTVNCEILGTKNPEITVNAMNNSSMVIKMYLGRKSILFLGDTGAESSQKLIENEKEKLPSDIVQMAHHGQNGATEELYKKIDPKICLWPTPEWLWNNDKGEGEDSGNWKTKETRNWMENMHVEKNIIEKDGDQTITVW